MRTLATAIRTTENAPAHLFARGYGGEVPESDSAPPASSFSEPMIQRKASCACGGGCPHCQAKALGIQPKLAISEPGDHYEQEADRVADQVMRMPERKVQRQAIPEEEAEEPILAKPLASAITPLLQRQVTSEEEKEALIQTKPDAHGGEEIGDLHASIEALRGGGEPLSASTRAFFEPRFGENFGSVRVHTDQPYADLARSIHARAFTAGRNVVFAQEQYKPTSTRGRRLLAHELTHTIQQGHCVNANGLPAIQRDEFEPWPGQTGHDVAGTRTQSGDIISEQVQRTGDPTYSALGPMLLEFNSRTCELTVRKELNFVNAGAGDAQLSGDVEFPALVARILAIANEQLNGWVSINVAQSDQCTLLCNGGSISVNVVTTEGTGSYSSTINLHRSFGRENAGNIGADASDRTIWHEVGHLVLGAADEYSEANRPDGTPRPASRVNESDWSIMSGEANARRAIMHARHFSHLPAWLGRRYPDCSFEINESSRPIVVEFSPVLFLGGFGNSRGGSGLYYSLGMDLGIPLDRLRRLELILGARFNYMMDLGSEEQHSLLLGFRAGLEGQFGSSGVRLGGFSEGGGVGFTNLETGEFGAIPYLEGGLNVGYSFGGDFNLGLEAAGGAREFTIPEPVAGSGPGTEFIPYFRLGLTIGGSF